MRPSARAVILALVLACPSAWAGQVTLTLPDVQLKSAIADVCNLKNCDEDGTKTDQEKAQWVADWAVRTISLGHYHDLSSVSGRMAVTYDE